MSTTTTPHTQTAYKDTPIGKIPADWEVRRLGDFIEKIIGGGTPSRDIPEYWNGNINWATVKDFTNFNAYSTQETITELGLKNSSTNLIPKGTLITATRMALGKAVKFEIDVAINQDLKAIFPKNNLDTEYLYYWFENNLKFFENLGNGSTVKGISLSDLKNLYFLAVPLPEQKRIAEVLSTWDKAIQLTEQLIRQKEQRKKWLMQNLLTGKMRLKGFSGESQFRVLGKFITEVSDRNKNGEIKNVLSVTNSKGFINQAEQFEREVASADVSNYKIVRKGQFAYNPSRVNVGSLDLLRKFDIGILSPMYVVFETDQKNLIPEYLYYLLKTNWFYGHIPMFVQGSVRDSLSFDGLCGMKFFIPSIEEQTAIAEVLQTAEKEIELRKAKAEKLKEQKKGLMQSLLTGKKRLVN